MKTHAGLLYICNDIAILDDGCGLRNYRQGNLTILPSAYRVGVFRLLLSVEKFPGGSGNGDGTLMRVGVCLTEGF